MVAERNMKSLLVCRKQLLHKVKRQIWSQPQGYDSRIKLYNCITRKKEQLILKDRSRLTWYTCGPTVYDVSHVGHASCYVKLDIIQSILKKHFNVNLITVMNITDIDDKIINRSNEKQVNVEKLARHYEGLFWKDLNSLGIKEPDIVLRVTDNMDLVIEFIRKLVDEGTAYKAADNSVYFDVEKGCKGYGKLQNIGEGMASKSTIKKSHMDFALWKASKEGEPFWKSPWGCGRPGWHVECSALATHALGSNIDIHSGGMDLKFPHHENEEALSCAFHGCSQWVNYWLHTGHLHLKDSEKMSKSLKNTVSIEEMLRSTTSEAFRMACAMSHYRAPMEYSQEMLETGANTLKTYLNFVRTCEDYKKGYIKSNIDSKKLKSVLEDTTNDIYEAFINDFDMPTVVSSLNKLVSITNSMMHSSPTSERNELSSVVGISNLVLKILDLMNFRLESETGGNKNDLLEVVEAAMEFRHEVRKKALKEKDNEYLKLCDTFRDKLKEAGVSIRDYKDKSNVSL